MRPLPCDEPSPPAAPADPDETTRAARWMAAELGRSIDREQRAGYEVARLAESLAYFCRQAAGRLSPTDAAHLRGLRARADEIAASLTAPAKPR